MSSAARRGAGASVRGTSGLESLGAGSPLQGQRERQHILVGSSVSFRARHLDVILAA